ncbi:MAG: hypothetical protein H7831_09665 [Magnetococcus sp. WYHC-3]
MTPEARCDGQVWPFLDPSWGQRVQAPHKGKAYAALERGWKMDHDLFMRHRHPGLGVEEVAGLRRCYWGEDVPVLSQALNSLARDYLEFRGGRAVLRAHRSAPGGESGATDPRSGCDLTQHEPDWGIVSRRVWPALMLAALWQGAPEHTPEGPEETQNLLAAAIQRDGLGDYHIHHGAAVSVSRLMPVLPPTASSLSYMLDKLDMGAMPAKDWAAADDLPVPRIHPLLLMLGVGVLSWVLRESLCLPPCQKAAGGKLPEPNRLAKDLIKQVWALVLAAPPQGKEGALSDIAGQVEILRRTMHVGDMLPQGYLQGSLPLSRVDAPFACWVLRRLRERSFAGVHDLTGSDLCHLAESWLWLVNAQFRFVVQQPGAPGLKNFRIWFRRLEQLSEYSKIPLEEKLRCVMARGRVRNLEMRIGSADGESTSWSDWALKWLRQFEEARKTIKEFPRLTFSVSLVKGGKTTDDGMNIGEYNIKEVFGEVPPGGTGPQDRQFARHVAKLCQFQRQALGFRHFVQRHPEILHLVRGWDVLSLERVLPNWVPGLVIQDFNVHLDPHLTKSTDPNTGAPRVPPPFHTLHAGEDYYLPSDGLRRVYECVVIGPLRRGERIGHGLILGLDLEWWVKRNPQACIPWGEWWDDLIWEWYLIHSGQMEGDLHGVESDLERLRRKWSKQCQESGSKVDCLEAGGRVSWHDHYLAYARRYNHDALSRDGLLPEGGEWLSKERLLPLRQSQDPVRRMHATYLLDPQHWQAGQTLHWLETSKYLERWKRLQSWMVQETNRRGVVVEICPSSNTYISTLNDAAKHPIFQLCPPQKPGLLPVCVNSDDPLTFNTDVYKEYILLYQSALRQGYPDHVARDWLERLHRMGMDYTFIPREWEYPESQRHKELEALRNKLE